MAGKSWEDVKREADLKSKEADEHWQKAKQLGDNAVSPVEYIFCPTNGIVVLSRNYVAKPLLYRNNRPVVTNAIMFAALFQVFVGTDTVQLFAFNKAANPLLYRINRLVVTIAIIFAALFPSLCQR